MASLSSLTAARLLVNCPRAHQRPKKLKLSGWQTLTPKNREVKKCTTGLSEGYQKFAQELQKITQSYPKGPKKYDPLCSLKVRDESKSLDFCRCAFSFNLVVVRAVTTGGRCLCGQPGQKLNTPSLLKLRDPIQGDLK